MKELKFSLKKQKNFQSKKMYSRCVYIHFSELVHLKFYPKKIINPVFLMSLRFYFLIRQNAQKIRIKFYNNTLISIAFPLLINSFYV